MVWTAMLWGLEWGCGKLHYSLPIFILFLRMRVGGACGCGGGAPCGFPREKPISFQTPVIVIPYHLKGKNILYKKNSQLHMYM